MDSLTFSTSPQGNSPEFRSAASAAPASRPTAGSTATGGVPGQPPTGQSRASADASYVEQASAVQARLNYDRDKGFVFVEILDPNTGDVIQRIPAESAADRIHELTGGYGGTVFDKIA
jgi:hypothetical protein